MVTKVSFVYSGIKDKIDDGTYAAGALLPSESQLAERFHTSRETIRKALARLREEGYIQSQKGKGSIVLTQQQFVFPVAGVVSYKELVERQNLQSTTKLLSKTIVDLPVARFATVEPNVTPWSATKLVRLRTVNDEPLIIDIDYIDRAIVPEISRTIAEDSLYQYFEHDLHLAIAYAKKEITVEPATAEDQAVLHLGPSNVVVVVRSATSLDDTTTFQFTESRHRPDRFRFQEFARRA